MNAHESGLPADKSKSVQHPPETLQSGPELDRVRSGRANPDKGQLFAEAVGVGEVVPKGSGSEHEFADFWQKEVHYYESRARDAGTKASQMLGVGLTLIAAAVATAFSYNKYQVLIGLPILMSLVWATAQRNLHEMRKLEVMVKYSEKQLERGAIKGKVLGRYRSWQQAVGSKEWQSFSNKVWVATALVVSALSIGFSLWMLFEVFKSALIIPFALSGYSIVMALFIGFAVRSTGRETAEMLERLEGPLEDPAKFGDVSSVA